jgi:hypothetical protein
MIISEKIHIAQKKYVCERCKNHIHPGELYHRLFGFGMKGDPPYEMFYHTTCRSKE